MGESEHRAARHYVAESLEVTIPRLTEVVGEVMGRVAGQLGAHGVPGHGGVIRYRGMSPDGTFAVDIGHLVAADDAAGTGLELHEIPAGDYAVVRHDGPYSDISDLSRGLMDSFTAEGARPVRAGEGTGVPYACWYELYLDMPRMGPRGPEGAVEIAVLLE